MWKVELNSASAGCACTWVHSELHPEEIPAPWQAVVMEGMEQNGWSGLLLDSVVASPVSSVPYVFVQKRKQTQSFNLGPN